MKQLCNNRELYEYLVHLASELKRSKSEALGDIVSSASRHAAGMSTEFLGESRIALRRVLAEEVGILGEQERANLKSTLEQLDKALDER